MPVFDDRDPDGLHQILVIPKLSVLKKHCRDLTIYRSDLANLILIGRSATSPLCHIPVFKHYHPNHLALSEKDLGALVGSGPGPFSKEARKTVNKLDQMMVQRRLFSGHLFWWVHEPDELPNLWYFFYFDQRDTDDSFSHWKHGSHLHLISHLTHPRQPLRALLQQLDEVDKPNLGRAIHIRLSH